MTSLMFCGIFGGVFVDFFLDLSFVVLTDPYHLMSPSCRQLAPLSGVGSSFADDIWEVTLYDLQPLHR